MHNLYEEDHLRRRVEHRQDLPAPKKGRVIEGMPPFFALAPAVRNPYPTFIHALPVSSLLEDGDMTTAKYIPEMADPIVRSFHPVRIILFGSHPRGDASPHSDVDPLGVLSQVDDKRKAAIEIRSSLSTFPVCKDVIVTTPDEIIRRSGLVGTVLRPALREGKVIYDQG